jgi:hypothetical protein
MPRDAAPGVLAASANVCKPCEEATLTILRRSLVRLATCATLAGALSGTVGAAPDSVYTSIRPADCAAPPAESETTYRARNLGVQQCPAPDG